ncbi:MAG: exonuclease domain-containing protein [Desulfobacterales bacterium]
MRLNPVGSYWPAVLLAAAAALSGAALLCLAAWQDLTPAERTAVGQILRRVGPTLALGGCLALFVGWMLAEWIDRRYRRPLREMSEQASILRGVTAARRIHVEGAPEVRRLAAEINELAALLEAGRERIEECVRAARGELEEEKRLLSSILAELPEGVLVCDPEGRIILYNERARQWFGEPPIGLGRSLLHFFDPGLFRQAREDVAARLRQGRAEPAVSFAARLPGGRLLKTTMAPVLGPTRGFRMLILIVADATEQDEAVRRAEQSLQGHFSALRRSLGVLRTTAELLNDTRSLAPEKRRMFEEILDRESRTAARAAEEAEAAWASLGPSAPTVSAVPAADFLDLLARRLRQAGGIEVDTEPPPPSLWIRVDGPAMATAVVFLVLRLAPPGERGGIRCRLERRESRALLDLSGGIGAPPDPARLSGWERETVDLGGEPLNTTAAEIFLRHRASWWVLPPAGTPGGTLRVMLEAADPPASPPPRRTTLLAGSRPVYYDFDLFAGRRPETRLLEQPLRRLACTAFDTETTGLDPEGGDEIVALGAVRLVNGRLLESEVFERLVRPGIDPRPESVRIHGLGAEILRDQPEAALVLREFARFAEGTVLIAHNAAFDMRLLTLQGGRAGVRFDQPVLDTLLLSLAVHPGHADHSLEAIAERLGVTILGRHTALGDARAAAEIFLRLAPLLEKAGIVTLAEALEASRGSLERRVRG